MKENEEIEKINEIYFRIVEHIKHGKLDQIILNMWDAQISSHKHDFEKSRKEAQIKIESIRNELNTIEDLIEKLEWEEK